ncbi:MAG: Phosphoheptose isomerase [uncultured bacterium]|nr:MAG: Phosphoheptose isomerase [uncultured bacterium]
MNKAVFLDRDGTINIDYGYVSDPKKFEFLPKAIEGLRKISELGYLLIIISNQSGIGRGYYTIEDYEKVTKKMLDYLTLQNIKIAECFYCPHSPESNCICRKPGTKMVEDAIAKWKVDPKQSYFIGDKESDIKAGSLSGLKTILISNTPKTFGQDFTATDLMNVADYILQSSEK